ncbi:MAG: molybdopterin-dependent oxidoreductase [Armatimonadota bacterium]|nr:molybdopterin-dependent oxidoreductase [Armatimonadota bacterium]
MRITRRFTRREVLGTAAAAGATYAAGRYLGAPLKGLVEAGPPPPAPTSIAAAGVLDLPSLCVNCHSYCAITGRVVNGRLWRVLANPDSGAMDGKVCVRAHFASQMLYDPTRLRRPLRRTNPEKGMGVDPRWVEVSWDEALDAIAAELRTLREAGEPHALTILRGRYDQAMSDLGYVRFARAFGTPNTISHGTICAEADKLGMYLATGIHEYWPVDVANANYLLLFGTSITEANRPVPKRVRAWGHPRRGRPTRAKVVSVTPRLDRTAARADEWLPINPGTDGALALAMAHVILTEGLWDREFVGDFAATASSTRFAPGVEMPEDAFRERWTAGLVRWWNLVLKDFTPERAAGITGIPAATIERIAREFAVTKPAIAFLGRGVGTHTNASYSAYAIFCLNGLAGSIDVPGGVVFAEPLPAKLREPPAEVLDAVAEQGLRQPPVDYRGTRLFPMAKDVTNRVAESIVRGEPYPIKAVIHFFGNFAYSNPDCRLWREALSKVRFMVHITTVLSDSRRPRAAGSSSARVC